MEETTHFDDLSVVLRNLRHGDTTAENRVHRVFVERLVRLASSRINQRFKAKIEPEEVVQSVFISFFRRCKKGDFHFDAWGDLWALLVKITVRKCANKVEGFMAAKRNVNREVEGKVGRSSDSSLAASGREPTPEEVAVFNESLDQLFGVLDEKQQKIVILRLQGHSNLEISEKLDCSERTIYRALNDVKAVFKKVDKDVEDEFNNA